MLVLGLDVNLYRRWTLVKLSLELDLHFALSAAAGVLGSADIFQHYSGRSMCSAALQCSLHHMLMNMKRR